MAGITSYPTTPAIGFAGQIADQTTRIVRSAINKEAGPIPFGLAVKKGTNDDEAILPTALADKIIGIAVHTHAMNNIGAAAWTPADAGIPSGERFDLLDRGPVYVKVEEAVTQYDLVYVRCLSGAGGTQRGSFRKSADTNTAALVKGARFLGSAAAGGIVALEFDALVANS